MDRKIHFILFTILTAAILTIYSHTLNSPFLFDDHPNIIDNIHIVIEKFSFNEIKNVINSEHPANNRKIPNLTFALNYLWSQYNPISYHITNITIHIFTSFLVFIFFLQTIRIFYNNQNTEWIAWGATFLWALHPIQINAVTYIVQRMTSLSAFFSLLTIICWMTGKKKWKLQKYKSSIFLGLIGVISWLCALLCKENAVIIPFLIIIQEIFIFHKGVIKWNYKFLFGSILVLALSLGLILFFLEYHPISIIRKSYQNREFNLIERLMTEARVCWYYIRLFFYPISSQYSLDHDFIVSRNLFSPITTFISIILWVLIVFISWFYRKKIPFFSWMVIGYLTAHSIESTIIGLEIIYEHRNYLPSIYLSLGMTVFVFNFLKESLVKFKLRLIIFSIFIITIGASTYTRNMDFKDSITFYLSELKRYPESPRNRHNLAIELAKSNNFLEAGIILEMLAKEYPDDFRVQKNWFSILKIFGKEKEAAIVFLNILDIINQENFKLSKDPDAIWNLARDLYLEGDYHNALILLKILAFEGQIADVWYLIGRCSIEIGEIDLAKKAFNEALSSMPKNAYSLFIFVNKLYLRQYSKKKACEHLTEALILTENELLIDELSPIIINECNGLEP